MTIRTVRDLFPGAVSVTYLNTAAMALGAATVRAAYEKAVAEWSEGRFDYQEAERAGENARASFARLVGAGAHEVAIVPAVSTAAGLVAAQMGPARSGENIVVGAEEYTSNYFPWLLLRELGYEIRTVPFERGGPTTEAYASHADARTRLIAVSAVQSASGKAADLASLAEIAHRGEGWLFVDASQAAGAVSLDVKAYDVDFLATSSHKFLCGTRGMGYLYVREALIPFTRPVGPGWKAAREPLASFYGPEMLLSNTASKLDTSLAWFAALGDQAALEIFAHFGARELYEKNIRLVRHLRELLSRHGLPGDAPDAPVRSTIVSFSVARPEEVMQRLSDAKVVTSLRAGKIRISLHFYNEPHELDLVVDAITRGGSAADPRPVRAP